MTERSVQQATATIPVDRQGSLMDDQKRLVRLSKLSPNWGSPQVHGMDNLDQLPKDSPSILVATHRTDSDMWVAASVVGEKIPILITEQSTHESNSGDALVYYKRLLVGQNNFLPISYRWHGETKRPEAFNLNDFEKIAEAMNHTGKNILIAAHNPGNSEKPGYGAAYLAMLSGALVVPLAVKMNPKTGLIGRKKPELSIGEPMEIRSGNLESFRDIMEKRRRGDKLNPRELETFVTFVKDLRKKGAQILKTLDALLPATNESA